MAGIIFFFRKSLISQLTNKNKWLKRILKLLVLILVSTSLIIFHKPISAYFTREGFDAFKYEKYGKAKNYFFTATLFHRNNFNAYFGLANSFEALSKIEEKYLEDAIKNYTKALKKIHLINNVEINPVADINLARLEIKKYIEYGEKLTDEEKRKNLINAEQRLISIRKIIPTKKIQIPIKTMMIIVVEFQLLNLTNQIGENCIY